MDLLAAFRTLVRVAETRSFSAVAREWGVTQPAVSRQVAALEKHLGMRLVQRTTHSLALTDDGLDVLKQMRQVLEAVDAMEETAGQRSGLVSGHVRLAVSVAFGLYLSSHIPGLLARHPELHLELVTADRLPNLVQEGLDLAVSVGELEADHAGSAVMRRIGTTHSVLVAAPSYLAAHPGITHPRDLMNCDCIIYTQAPDAQVWRFAGPGEEVSVTVDGRFRADNRESVHAAAVSGQGIALLSDVRARNDLATGRLVHLLPGWQTPAAPVYVVYPSRRNLPARTRVVIDFLIAEVGSITADNGQHE